ncbi:hypothetical protein [Escherichia coli]|uniref:hypothetical protein n=2 Tax=Escherichia coli TaxID=562 RepID=UPI000250E0F9|nr:hypothetical protein [Escherichia coli]EGK3835890.1 hypothetical protein [Escherichia coli]EHV32115.1 hypothetical protein ECDEC5B_2331 [Escherichia coli DEC5B]EIN2668700.1 hypothetical protein [Escherichia coli]EJO9466281.1 hypothetical protein [Escherichia coli]MCX0656847.1 hypothetical protein [Escherichia coli]
MGIYVYADESGHSGKSIFDSRAPKYYQGAIISLGDIDHIVGDVVNRYCERLNVSRIHSNQHQEHVISAICEDLIEALKYISWQFSLCIINKPYLAPTKFVDLFFDSSDNPRVPFLWYNSDLLRHSICLVVNELLTKEDCVKFWDAYLSDSMPVMLQVAETLLTRIDRVSDPRMNEVILGGLQYAISHPSEFELICTQGKSAYKGQTPNMVAFSSLMFATHTFCKTHSSSVEELIHDRSDEFRGTMREYYKIFHKLAHVEDDLGGPTLFEEAEFDLGTFNLRGSELHPALQAVDVFLWMTQRKLNTERGREVLGRLKQYISDFEISPDMSRLIVLARIYQFNNKGIISAINIKENK